MRNVLASEGSVFYGCCGRIPLGGTGADRPSAPSSAASTLGGSRRRSQEKFLMSEYNSGYGKQ